jgi:hypothetical protein
MAVFLSTVFHAEALHYFGTNTLQLKAAFSFLTNVGVGYRAL